MPLPSDELFHKAGFPHAASLAFHETNEVINIEAPGTPVYLRIIEK